MRLLDMLTVTMLVMALASAEDWVPPDGCECASNAKIRAKYDSFGTMLYDEYTWADECDTNPGGSTYVCYVERSLDLDGEETCTQARLSTRSTHKYVRCVEAVPGQGDANTGPHITTTFSTSVVSGDRRRLEDAGVTPEVVMDTVCQYAVADVQAKNPDHNVSCTSEVETPTEDEKDEQMATPCKDNKGIPWTADKLQSKKCLYWLNMGLTCDSVWEEMCPDQNHPVNAALNGSTLADNPACRTKCGVAPGDCDKKGMCCPENYTCGLNASRTKNACVAENGAEVAAIKCDAGCKPKAAGHGAKCGVAETPEECANMKNMFTGTPICVWAGTGRRRIWGVFKSNWRAYVSTFKSIFGRRRLEGEAGCSMLKQLSEKPCDFGTTWGCDVENQLVWATEGCRGRFANNEKPDLGFHCGAGEHPDTRYECPFPRYGEMSEETKQQIIATMDASVAECGEALGVPIEVEEVVVEEEEVCGFPGMRMKMRKRDQTRSFRNCPNSCECATLCRGEQAWLYSKTRRACYCRNRPSAEKRNRTTRNKNYVSSMAVETGW